MLMLVVVKINTLLIHLLEKITAIGKSRSQVPVRPSNNKQQLAFAGGNRNVVNSALNRVRNGGATTK